MGKSLLYILHLLIGFWLVLPLTVAIASVFINTTSEPVMQSDTVPVISGWAFLLGFLAAFIYWVKSYRWVFKKRVNQNQNKESSQGRRTSAAPYKHKQVRDLSKNQSIFEKIFGKSKKRLQAEEEERLAQLVQKHQPALIRNYYKFVTVNDYGKKYYDEWFGELDYFLDSTNFISRFIPRQNAIRKVASWVIYDIENGNTSPISEAIPSDPYQFEEWCALKLSQIGWNAKATSGSGDQGIDVLAKKDNIVAVLQCKLYSKPVGNKAVQEAISGKAFARAHVAAVVAPNGFTRSAEELARTTGVLLLEPRHLEHFDRFIVVN